MIFTLDEVAERFAADHVRGRNPRVHTKCDQGVADIGLIVRQVANHFRNIQELLGLAKPSPHDFVVAFLESSRH